MSHLNTSYSPQDNKVQFGSNRDRQILQAIEEHGALCIEQIADLFFPFRTGLRKAQERMNVLYASKRVNRVRLGRGSSIYLLGKPNPQLEHLVDSNWLYVWFSTHLAAWQRFYHWQRELDFGILRCDSFCGIENTITREARFYFAEMEREANKSEFDKPQIYNRLYGEQYARMSHFGWFKHMSVFPKIYIVVEQESKRQKALEVIDRENTNNLRFEVKLLDEIKQEARRYGGIL